MYEVAYNITKKQEGEEIWLPVVGYEDLYEVSNSGRVRRINQTKYTYLRPSLNRGLYLRVSLSRENKSKTFTVHRLVASAFVPNPDSKQEIDHMNGNRMDNRASNLLWVTHIENMIKRGGNSNSWWAKHKHDYRKKTRRSSPRGVSRIQERIDADGTFEMNTQNFETKSFQEIWEMLTAEQRNELARKLFSARCCSTYQTVWNWGKGKVSPYSPLVKMAVASTISRLTGQKISPATLFPNAR